jgi:hypothetical protein
MPLRRTGLLRPTLLTLLTLAASLASATAAWADAATIAVTTPAGQVDPVADVGRVFTVTGISDGPKYLFVAHRPAGGAPCAPSYQSDTGEGISALSRTSVNGPFSVQAAIGWDKVGSELFCMWLAGDSFEVSVPFAQTITFRAPVGAISAAIAPAVPRPGQAAQVTVSGSTEAPREVFASVRPAGPGAACAPSYATDGSGGRENLAFASSVDGAFTLSASTSQSDPGPYLVCLWLAKTYSDPAPIAANALRFDVVAPSPTVRATRVVSCRTSRRLRRVHARTTPALCLRYRFAEPPAIGQTLSVAFLTPRHRIARRVTTVFSGHGGSTATIGSLRRASYRHRRGVWSAVLRVAGRRVAVMRFRVV